MKKGILQFTALAIFLFLLSTAYAQVAFVHTSSTTNSKGNVTTLNHPSLNNKPNAFILVEQRFIGTYNAHEIGVFYGQGKWHIFNQGRSTLKPNLSFNVLVVDPMKLNPSQAHAFVHVAVTPNSHMTSINNSFTNNDPNLRLLITQNWGSLGPYNNHAVGVWYSANKWIIYNEDGKAMPKNAKFNVLAIKGNAGSNVIGNALKSSISVFKSSGTNTQAHISTLNTGFYSDKEALLFTTHDYRTSGPYHKSPTGIWFSGNSWKLFNQDVKRFPANATYNVLSIKALQSNSPTTASDSVPPIILMHDKIEIRDYIEVLQNSEQTKTEPEGPGGTIINPFESIFFEPSVGDRFTGHEFSRIGINVYADKVPGSATFYYLPKSFHINWDNDLQKYDLDITYNKNDEDPESKNVRVSTKLTSGITLKEVEFLRGILEKRFNITKVYLLPMVVNEAQLSIESGESFNIYNLSTVALNDFTKPARISFTTDETGIDEITYALQNDQPLPFVLNLKCESIDSEIPIEANIKLADPGSFKGLEFDIGSMSTHMNPTPYPLLVKYLHTLTVKPDGTPVIYSFDLGDQRVNPNDKLRFITNTTFKLPTWVRNGSRPHKTWVDYKVLECESCNQKILNDLTGGLTNATKEPVHFRTINVLNSSGAEYLWIYLKSKQLDPNRAEEVTLARPIEITADGDDFESPPLYLNQNETPDFEYKIILVTRQGDAVPSPTNEWLQGNSLNVLLGKNDVKAYFGDWPDNEIEE